MTRTKIIIALLVALLGFAAGWWLFGLGYTPLVNPVAQQAASSARPRVTSGYCCLVAGQACEEVENPAACFSAQGRGFNTGKTTCDTFCVRIGILQSRAR